MLSIGMPYELYWYGEPQAVDYYLGSLRYRDMVNNQNFHLQGVYFLKALQEVLQFTQNPQEIYPRHPIELGTENVQETQESIESDMKAAFDRIRRKE